MTSSFDPPPWLPPDEHSFRLEETIDIWKLDRDLLPDCLPFDASLSSEERLRAESCGSPAVRRRFVQTRFVLRELLSRYLRRSPREIALSVSPRGQVSLRNPSVQFSLSHSGSMLLLAFCRGRRVGVDVERIRIRKRLSSLAERCLGAAELSIFQSADLESRLELFYRSWNLKEALLKAWGDERKVSMKDIDLREIGSGCFDYSAKLEPFSCRLRTLPEPCVGYAAALAFEGEALPPRLGDASLLFRP